MGEIKVVVKMLEANEELAFKNRELLKEQGIYLLNMISSPGSGKTSLLEQMILRLKAKFKMAVIEGDLYTTRDAARIEAQGVPVVQINTQGACHLDSRMIYEALKQLDLAQLELIIIENVGNLVCPAEFDLGEDAKITVLSVTEGNDKPLKYPLIFEKSEVVILNKMDLLYYTNFDLKEFYDDLHTINNQLIVFETSCCFETGLAELSNWISSKVRIFKEGDFGKKVVD